MVQPRRDGRNRWAHQDAFTTDDAYRVLDSIHRLLTAIAAEAAAEVDRQRQELLRINFDSQARKRQRRVAQAALVEGRPREGFRPWRELVTPHPDVSSGHYQEAEFAADLGQVQRGEGSDEYRDPVQFYRRTHITEGLHRLLVNTLRRLAGEGGDPVVELQTNFGGGKTHSMLALYHLFSADRASDLVGIEPVLAEAAVEQVPRARIAVLVGTVLSPGQTHEKVRRGGALFGEAGPCLVLIDEWLAHARRAHCAPYAWLTLRRIPDSPALSSRPTRAARSSARDRLRISTMIPG